MAALLFVYKLRSPHERHDLCLSILFSIRLGSQRKILQYEVRKKSFKWLLMRLCTQSFHRDGIASGVYARQPKGSVRISFPCDDNDNDDGAINQGTCCDETETEVTRCNKQSQLIEEGACLRHQRPRRDAFQTSSHAATSKH